MLELKKITKIYNTESFKQRALDEINISFRHNEFAAILGPSGSGKTTLLNIIGGLDKYTSGDLIINETSTKKYNDRDWDSYRNHRVGFVFQNYNLITHQSILANVELALTLSGVSKKERTKRAKEALSLVGLKEHIKKLPNQLSGGQMQRVAIARALVNNPDIILADEPTGALDSETSTQVMNILKDVAKDKLVIMVTHNEELANIYSTRIIKLKDGKVIDDTNPYNGKIDTKEELEIEKQKSKKTSMNLRTALSLSLNNLMTKKGRTILTAFAGSIGIIGIALILSLSTGVQNYINKEEREALTSYPISIESTNIDLTSMMNSSAMINQKDIVCEKNKICTMDNISTSFEVQQTLSTKENNLQAFKNHIDKNSKINDYVSAIKYVYDIDLQIYSNKNNNIVKVNPNTLTLTDNSMQYPVASSAIEMPTMLNTSANVFKELINSDELLNSQYDILSGTLPKNYNEMVLIVDKDNKIPISVMYALDIEKREELLEKINNMKKDENIELSSINYNYNDLIGNTFKLILNTDYYVKENGKWIDKSLDTDYLKNIVNKGLEIKIVGVIKLSGDNENTSSGYVGYTNKLSEYVINEINKTDLAKEQSANENINILTNAPFDGYLNTYKSNLKKLGIADLSNPSRIDIYPKNFESKDKIEEFINDYNKVERDNKREENVIEYTDMIGVLLSSVTSIVNVISYVLIAFVAISLVVSSIMIAIITYISVLERTKEIGILRAIGASKKDVSRVFNAETIIEGFIAGVLGIGIAFLLTIPANAIVNSLAGIENIATLPINGSIILIIISVLLTVIAGLIPAKMASKKDPVVALRSE